MNNDGFIDSLTSIISESSTTAGQSFKTDLENTEVCQMHKEDLQKVNSLLRLKFSSLDRSTVDERDYLCSPSDNKSWLENFKTVLLSPLLQEVYNEQKSS